MEPLDNLNKQEVLHRLKTDLLELDALTKVPLDETSSPKIIKLTGHIFQCAHSLEHHLKVKFKRNLLGIVEDFEDYNLNTSPSERHQYKQILQKNINQVLADIDHAMLKRKAA